MSDCGHDHSHDGLQSARHAQHKSDGGRLLAALIVVAVFMVVEVIGGLWSGSLALLADATHMMTDALALTLALSAHWISARPANAKLHFGYRRMQVIAAFLNGIALIVLMAWIVYEAVRRSINPIEVDWAPMLAIAALGLFANGVAFRLLHRAGDRNINIKSAMLHVASDLLGSIAAVVAAIVIWQTGWTRIDPLLSLLVAVLIGRSAVKLLTETTHILLEGAPKNFDVAALTSDLAVASPLIEDIHSVKISQLTPDQLRLTMHARIRDGAPAADALHALKKRLEERYGIGDSTIQIESGCSCPDDAPEREPAPEDAKVTRLHAHDRAHDHAHDKGRDHRRATGGDEGPARGRGVGGAAVAAIQSILK
ncbi:MAG: cation transporter [Parvularculaceae bacterium]|nr:cation transporter [Parvularculaceae bacterium]